MARIKHQVTVRQMTKRDLARAQAAARRRRKLAAKKGNVAYVESAGGAERWIAERWDDGRVHVHHQGAGTREWREVG